MRIVEELMQFDFHWICETCDDQNRFSKLKRSFLSNHFGMSENIMGKKRQNMSDVVRFPYLMTIKINFCLQNIVNIEIYENLFGILIR